MDELFEVDFFLRGAFGIDYEIRITLVGVGFNIEDFVLTATTKVGVDDEDFFVFLSEGGGEVGANETFTVTRGWGGKEDDFEVAVDGGKLDVSLDRFDSFGKGRFRVIIND